MISHHDLRWLGAWAPACCHAAYRESSLALFGLAVSFPSTTTHTRGSPSIVLQPISPLSTAIMASATLGRRVCRRVWRGSRRCSRWISGAAAHIPSPSLSLALLLSISLAHYLSCSTSPPESLFLAQSKVMDLSSSCPYRLDHIYSQLAFLPSVQLLRTKYPTFSPVAVSP